jgi:hypothetical protein
MRAHGFRFDGEVVAAERTTFNDDDSVVLEVGSSVCLSRGEDAFAAPAAAGAFIPPMPGNLGASLGVTNTNNSGAGSLRAAIIDANGNAGRDTIMLNIPGVNPTITLEGDLPPITDAVVIDGTSMPGYTSVPRVTIDAVMTSTDVLNLASGSDGSLIKGLSIVNASMGAGIRIQSSRASVAGNWIGVQPSGAVSGNATGILIDDGATGTIIGGAMSSDANVIGGSQGAGIELHGDDSVIVGNYIGRRFDPVDVPNEIGVSIEATASGNLVGGTPFEPWFQNHISGNRSEDVKQAGSGNTVYIGQ